MTVQIIIWNLFIFRYATEVDVDFVRKSVRAIGRCAIKVEVGYFLSFFKLESVCSSFPFILFPVLVRLNDSSSWKSRLTV